MGIWRTIFDEIAGNKQLEFVWRFDIIMVSDEKEGKLEMSDEMKMMVNAIIEEIGRVENKMNQRFDKVDARFDKIELRFDVMQHEINAVN